MEVQQLSRGIARIERDGRNYLGIDTGISGKSFTVTRFSNARNSRGLLIRGQVIEFWMLNGFLEHDGKIYLYGPYLKGTSLAGILEQPDIDLLPTILRIAEALSLLALRSIPLTQVHSDGILLLEDGGILILPPDLLSLVKDHRPLEQRIITYERFNHPDYRDGRNALFALGVLSYLAMIGTVPFPQEDEEELHERIRDMNILPPIYRDPSVRPDVSETVMQALRPEGDPEEITRFRDSVANWIREGARRPIDDEEAERIRSRGAALERKHHEDLRRKAFLRRHGKAILVSGIFAVAAAWILFSILSNVFAPRVTEGFPPLEVVRTFYTSVNSLDHVTMEDCVIDGAGKQMISEVTNLYVLSRVRYSVEGSFGFVDAAEWVAQGQPDLPPDRSVYGIANLEITPSDARPPDRDESEESLAFRAVYEKWMPVHPEPMEDTVGSSRSGGTADAAGSSDQAAAAPATSVGVRMTDLLFLTRDRDDWVIYRIDRVREEPVAPATAPR